MATVPSISLEYNGQPVYIFNQDRWGRNKKVEKFLIFNADKVEMVEVPEAVVVKKKPAVIPSSFIEKELKSRKLPLDAKREENRGYPHFVKQRHYKGSIFSNRNDCAFNYTNLEGRECSIGEKAYNDFCEFESFLEAHTILFTNIHTNEFLATSIVLGIIGIGKTVTLDSLSNGCAKDEKTPRFQIGDTVGWYKRGGINWKMCGTIKSFKKEGMAVLLADGTVENAPYESAVKETPKIDKSFEKVLPKSILDNFDSVVENARLFRSGIKTKMIDSPYLSGKNEQECKVANCPNCQTFLAEENSWRSGDGQYKCVQCGQRAYLIDERDGIGTFIMADKPAKNKFCLDVAKCCDNCALFKFAVGRQGKRRTGYCTFTNQCVVAHTVCPRWMPDIPSKFEATIKQHVTNLGTGVADRGNYDHMNKTRIEGEIDDKIYREADHEEQKKVATALKGAYNVAYVAFIQKLLKKAESVPVEEL